MQTDFHVQSKLPHIRDRAAHFEVEGLTRSLKGEVVARVGGDDSLTQKVCFLL